MTASQPPETRYRRIMAKRCSGETLRALAERHGVKPRTFYWWHHRFKEREPAPEAAELVPVDLPASPGLDLGALLGPTFFEVSLRQSGHVVRVPSTFDSGSLARLVSLLERE